MPDRTLASRDEVERFKVYIEIAKYAISIVIALAAVCGVILKNLAGATSRWGLFFFVVGIVVNVVLYIVAHRLVSEATEAITHEATTEQRDAKLAGINRSTYSLFVIIFISSLIYWSVAIAVSVVL
ncbi:hypothetical protein [Prosthecomicrobium sp. N25]|uniref:hypothetical protein n=1 Tax=Prosthecomicrobium sp. N25 TaxID=3129254 RepID=UPI00307753FB